MKTYVALLRGINVGGRNSLPMKELKEIFAALGCKNVQTYIQSGNVVLQSSAQSTAKRAAEISDAIERYKGFRPQVLLLERSDLEEAMANNPFPEAVSNPKSLHLGFLESEPENPDLEALEGIRAESERFHLKGRVFYLHAPDGVGRSKLAARSERLLGVPLTDRNWRTVEQLMAMVEAQS